MRLGRSAQRTDVNSMPDALQEPAGAAFPTGGPTACAGALPEAPVEGDPELEMVFLTGANLHPLNGSGNAHVAGPALTLSQRPARERIPPVWACASFGPIRPHGCSFPRLMIECLGLVFPHKRTAALYRFCPASKCAGIISPVLPVPLGALSIVCRKGKRF